MIHLNLNLSPTQKKMIKAVGYPAFFSMCFSVFLALTFPAERFLPMAEAQLSDFLGRKVTIDDLSISPFGSVTLSGVNIEVPVEEDKKQHSRGADEDEDEEEEEDADKETAAPKPIIPKYYIEEMNLDVGILSLLFGELELNVNMDFLGGKVEVSYKGPITSSKKEAASETIDVEMTPAERAKKLREMRAGKTEEASDEQKEDVPEDEEDEELSLSMVATDLNLIQAWDLKDFLPLPMFGQLNFGIELVTKTGKFKDAEGKMWVDGKNISFGQGQSQVELIEDMGPLTVDSIGIQSLVLEMAVKEGKCSFKNVKLTSNDIAATAEGDIQFADPMAHSRMNLYFTFKLLDGYAQKSDKAKTLVSLMPTALSRAKRADDSFGYVYQGLFKTAKFRPSRVFASGERTRRTTALRRGSRPTSNNRPGGVTRAKRPPVTTAPPPRIIEPEPDVQMEAEPEPELMEPEETGEPMDPRAEGPNSSFELQRRQSDSQSRRMEATIRAMKDNEEGEASGEEEEGAEEGEVEETTEDAAVEDNDGGEGGEGEEGEEEAEE